MRVTVKFSPPMSTLTKRDQVEIELHENARLIDLLEILKERYGESLMDLLYMQEHDPVDVWASIIVQGQVVPLPLTQKSNARLVDSVVVVLMTPASGG